MRPRSRWLVVGREGSGKSMTPWYLAEQFPLNRIYILDTEDKHAGINYRKGSKPTNLEYYFSASWDEIREQYLKWSKQFKPGDWFVIDSVGLLMDDIEDAFRKKEGDNTLASFGTNIKLEIQDYGETKPRFFALVNHVLFRVLGLNVIIIAQAKPYIRVKDKKTQQEVVYGKKPDEIMQSLDRFDVNPDAENSIKYNVETILQTSTSGKLFFFRVLKHPLYEVSGEQVDFTNKGLWTAFNEHLKLDIKETPGL